MIETRITKDLIAICGMNCHLCLAYKRKKNGCHGCRAEDGLSIDYCNRCKMKNCETAIAGNFTFCYECESFPCKLVKHIDKRYRTKYSMSMIENLNFIKEFGIEKFLEQQEEKWTCPECGQILCAHRPQCLNCKYIWRE